MHSRLWHRHTLSTVAQACRPHTECWGPNSTIQCGVAILTPHQVPDPYSIVAAPHLEEVEGLLVLGGQGCVRHPLHEGPGHLLDGGLGVLVPEGLPAVLARGWPGSTLDVTDPHYIMPHSSAARSSVAHYRCQSIRGGLAPWLLLLLQLPSIRPKSNNATHKEGMLTTHVLGPQSTAPMPLPHNPPCHWHARGTHCRMQPHE
jgi:hypothetical protein